MLFDRYGIMTTNIAEVYNWVIKGLCGLSIIAIIEGMLYGIIGYYQKRHAAIVSHCTTMSTLYAQRMMEYL